MPEASIEVRGVRGAPDDPMAAARPADSECRAEIKIVGDRFLNATVALTYDGRSILAAPQPQSHAFCRYIMGKPYRAWANALLDLPEAAQGMTLELPAYTSTTEQNLIKACCLVYLWVEPALLGNDTARVEEMLTDNFVVDYSGRAGPQSLIYFPAEEFQNTASPELRELYSQRVLCRLTVTTHDARVERFFTPIVPASLRVSALSAASYHKWLAIKDRLAAVVRKGMRNS
jgi:hypothetical protein